MRYETLSNAKLSSDIENKSNVTPEVSPLELTMSGYKCIL